MLCLTEKKMPIQREGWAITIRFMHGDADAYTQEILKFKYQESVLTTVNFLATILKEQEQYHNAFCDLYAEREVYQNPELTKQLLKGKDSLYELFEEYGVSLPTDTVHSGYAHLSKIVEILYNDGVGGRIYYDYELKD